MKTPIASKTEQIVTKPRKQGIPAAVVGSQLESKVSSQRKPRCHHCKKPKAGHPRSGCPYPVPSGDTEVGSLAVTPVISVMSLTSKPDNPRIYPESTSTQTSCQRYVFWMR